MYQFRLIFIAESGVQTANGTAALEMGDRLTRSEVASKARAYLETQWPDEDRQYYQQFYDQGMAALQAFEHSESTHCLFNVEFGWLFITC